MSYETFKVVHLLGVILFLGNIIVTGAWKVLADRTGEPRVIAYAQRVVTLTDWIFTAGGAALILIGAYGMAAVGHLDLRGSAWLIWGQAIFVASGVIWLIILIPTQILQARQARAFADTRAPLRETPYGPMISCRTPFCVRSVRSISGSQARIYAPGCLRSCTINT